MSASVSYEDAATRLRAAYAGAPLAPLRDVLAPPEENSLKDRRMEQVIGK